MEQILIVRETVVKFFKRYEVFILPILKFLVGWFVFASILAIGQVNPALEPFAEFMQPTMLALLFALLFTIMPMNMSWMLIILTLTLQYSANLEIAVAVFLFAMFIFLFYARMAPKESILILLTILAFHFNVPYLTPIIVGLYFPITAIIPVVVGVFVHAQIPMLEGLVASASVVGTGMADMEITELIAEMPEAFSVVYEALIRSLTMTQNWLFTAVVFAMVVLLVHFISKLAIDFAKEVAIALGCVMNIFGFVVAAFVAGANVNILSVIGLTLLSGVLVLIIRCFDAILDYNRAETVQFEDDDNFYHVRIVPKVIISKPQRVVKRIRPDKDDLTYEARHRSSSVVYEDDEFYDDDFVPPLPREHRHTGTRPTPGPRPRPNPAPPPEEDI